MAVQTPDENNLGVEIDDPEELAQTKRIREILNRRRGVLEARDRAMDEATLGEVQERRALQHYQSRIESLILDLWTKFQQMEVEQGEQETGIDYLKNKTIDTITIHPPETLFPNGDSGMASGVSAPEPQTETIRGLEWFINKEPVIAKSFTVTSWDPPGELTDTNSRYVPIRTLDKALLACMEFIDKAGIDAKFEQKEQRTKIDRDLLEEVDEWRQHNVNND